ncbi:hypothetical protein M9H77_02998 [Catharanthus roseus]|uniref:Uncharacterized protein n=1 Tax=Catharanthus roseus TaxID=4058 RepID=A0ACC0C9Z2_CATRO|nr:hypothetical protein M9H77_02998 [Catharanthus roseus]
MVPLEEGRRPQRLWPNQSMWAPHHALRWGGRLVENQEGLETKVGPKTDLFIAERHADTLLSRSRPSGRVGGSIGGIRASRFIARLELLDFRQAIGVNCLTLMSTIRFVEREPIPIINLKDKETVEGLVVQRVEPGLSIKKDPSETESDVRMLPEPEGVAPVDTEGMDTLAAGGSPIEPASSWSLGPEVLVADTPRRSRLGVGFSNMSDSRPSNLADEAMSENSQRSRPEPIRENTPRPEQATHTIIENFMIRMTELLETSMTTRRNERVWATGADKALERFLKFQPPEFYEEVKQEIKAELFLEQLNDIYDTLKVELQRALAPLPPMGFASLVEAVTRTEIADQAVTQRKAVIGSRPGQGPWKSEDSKRPSGHVRDQCLEMQRVPSETSRRTGRPPAMRGAIQEKSDKPQVKAKVYTLDGLPVDTKVEVVEATYDFLRAWDNLRKSNGRTSKGIAVTDWTQPKIPIEGVGL